MGRWNSSKRLLLAVAVDGLFFPQRLTLGLDPRQSTPGFKRQLIVLDAETRSLKRAAIVMKRLNGWDVSTNTIERIALEVGNDLEAAEQTQWQSVLTGKVTVPEVAIIEFDGGRIRTRKTGCGAGVHLDGKGWNETKNAIFVSATSETSEADPHPLPPKCFLDPEHVAKLTEQAKIKEKQDGEDALPADDEQHEAEEHAVGNSAHKPKRVLRTVISSMKESKRFVHQMRREANRRRFDEAMRKAFVADGLTCNWTIHAKHFRDYIPILDFTHAVSYLFTASVACLGKSDAAWSSYVRWMTMAWQGDVAAVIEELREHQQRIGLPPADATASANEDDPRESLRRVIGYLENNRTRMKYPEYRQAGLPTTSAWMESAVKEINYRIKGTEMFWNNPAGAEAILQIRAASLSDDDRLIRFLTNRPGQSTLRRTSNLKQAA
jgi:hypothetical protein